MIKVRNLTTLVALGSLAALPACSWFGGGSSQTSRSSYPSQSYASTTPTTQPEMSADTIQQVQQNLQQQGLYKGRVDGMWGPRTEAAVRQFQSAHNLNATGQLDMNTLSALNVQASNSQPSNQRYSAYNPSSMSNSPSNSGANSSSDQSGVANTR